MRNIIRKASFIALILALAMVVGCGIDNSPTQSENIAQQPEQYGSFQEAMAAINSVVGDRTPDPVFAAPSSGVWSITEEVENDRDNEIELNIPGVAEEIDFEVFEDSMSMNGVPVDEVDISMTVTIEVVEGPDGDKVNAINFEFGPSGLQFDPMAEIEISFELLTGLDIQELVMESESAGDLEDVSFEVDWDKDELEIYVPHFSQYYYRR